MLKLYNKIMKNLGFKELLAIAVGGMVGGGIFTILGISVAMVGALAPFAIALGGFVAWAAAYSYVKMGVYYKDEGATYAFFKRTYPSSHLAASFIGWYTIFGYISTLALYAYTFSSYIISGFDFAHNDVIRKIVAIGVIVLFALINLWSVKGMGRIEDLMVYVKLIILALISILLIYYAKIDFHTFASMVQSDFHSTPLMSILIVSSITFVAYEGFQLVINAVNEMENPDKNIPRAIYSAIILVASIYFIIALGAVLAIPAADLIHNKESALASGVGEIMGNIGQNFVIFGAVLATSSAINGTLFGASRQMARISDDGYLPPIISHRQNNIPTTAIIAMTGTASLLIAVGGLRLILEFGSITFLLVSFLMSIANFKIRNATKSSYIITISSIVTLFIGTLLILYYEYKTNAEQLLFIGVLYIALSVGAFGYANLHRRFRIFK
ncbi:APC family permease [Sulfurimonas autotrophica]|uniref:Amino acid permease-associated region n=1 Tax=Sulfurimonas autotrophica (strain ATCC BAA-671 / DSM 16294 / JCM 11897 / OK10) TaxID=563040 RepID=E0UTT3_SULAO|nr:APC family permease [Sulfurimonas autotrophica]ADN09377.1 amino acid permease-associated region [Sulfurimonas autotrophica DSM 16294]